MNLFNGGGLFNSGPSIVEKIDMLFKDVETEGKKQGYERASKEYSKVFCAIEEEYKRTKKLIEDQKNHYDIKSGILIEKLEELEKQKAELEKRVSQKSKDISNKYNISLGDVKASLAAGTLFMEGPLTIDILGIIYNHKEKKLKAAEQRGYLEAKKLYEEKIERLKKDLKILKQKGNKEIQELLDLINELFDAIAKEQMKIASLQILL